VLIVCTTSYAAAKRPPIYRDEMLPFSISIAALSLAQAAIVALPRVPQPIEDRAASVRGLRGRRWALVPPLSVIAFAIVVGAAERASAQGLTYLALIAVPALAAVALGWLTPGARPRRALLVAALFALAWAVPGDLLGQGAALALSALSCVALGVLLASVTPPRWLGAGIVAMALADTALVVSELLQKPNRALNAAHPAAGLPRLQDATFGSAVIGYGDLFVAGTLGALLAVALGRSQQRRGAALAGAFALALDLLFFVVDELPATVPIALTLIVVTALRRRRSAPSEPARAPQAPGARRPAPGLPSHAPGLPESARRASPPPRSPAAP
jgi:hypothetical protein